MELIDVINQIVANAVQASQPTDLAIGTVQSIEPLTVKLDTNQQVIRKEILYRTEAVVERKFRLENHYHTAGQGTTSSNKSRVTALVDGKAAETEGDYIILNKGLAKGDKVLLLAVQGGQKFIILSRII